jgi:hypothetical protein
MRRDADMPAVEAYEMTGGEFVCEVLRLLGAKRQRDGVWPAVLKCEAQHPDSYRVLPWKNNINSYSLKSG